MWTVEVKAFGFWWILESQWVVVARSVTRGMVECSNGIKAQHTCHKETNKTETGWKGSSNSLETGK